MTDFRWSKTITFFEGKWHEGNLPIMGVRTHAAWLCSMVFDGGRAFEGVTPDLELHCARVSESARKLYLNPTVSTETWIGLAHEGIKKFDGSVALSSGQCIGQRWKVRGFSPIFRKALGGAWRSTKRRCGRLEDFLRRSLPFAVPRLRACQWMLRPVACIRTTHAPYLKPRRAASTTPLSAT